MFLILRSIIRNNPIYFLFCSLFAIIVALINFNLGICLKNQFVTGKTTSSGTNIFTRQDYVFEFIFAPGGLRITRPDLSIWGFIAHIFPLYLFAKSSLSTIHYFLMHYCYDGIERDLKKDLFRQFIRANYPQGSVVVPSLITQFAQDLDTIAEHIWFIPNRLILVFVAINYHLLYDFNFGKEGKGTNWAFVVILFSLFFLLLAVQMFLFPRAAKMGLIAKKRVEKDNEIIFERINNLEYIKATGGENYEEKKIA
jgi:ABC-type multidrug transport system fused ATPase/permease subunit